MTGHTKKQFDVNSLIKIINENKLEKEKEGHIRCSGWGLDDGDVKSILTALTTTMPLQQVHTLDFSNNKDITTFKLDYASEDTNNIVVINLSNNTNLKEISLIGATGTLSNIYLKNVEPKLINKTIERYIGSDYILDTSDFENNNYTINYLNGYRVDHGLGDHGLGDYGLDEFESFQPASNNISSFIGLSDDIDTELNNSLYHHQSNQLNEAYASYLKLGVSMRLWYTDQIMNDVIKNSAISVDLEFSNDNSGILQDINTKERYMSNSKNSMSYCPVIAIGSSEIDMTARFNELQSRIEKIKDTTDIENHIILMPVNRDNSHWCFATLSLKVITVNNVRKLSSEVKLDVYDSSYAAFPAELVSRLNHVLSSFELVNPITENTKTTFQTKRQTDASSCGPIVIDYLLDFISHGELYPSTEEYTNEEIFLLRREHMNLPGNEYLIQLQTTDTANVQLKAPDTAEAATELTPILSSILKSILQDKKDSFLEAAKNFVEYQENSETSELVDSISTIKSILNCNDVYKEFSQHIFAGSLSDDSLRWKDNGLDNLLAALKQVLMIESNSASMPSTGMHHAFNYYKQETYEQLDETNEAATTEPPSKSARFSNNCFN